MIDSPIHLSSSIIIYHHLSSSIIIYHHLSSSIIIYHHLSIYHHVSIDLYRPNIKIHSIPLKSGALVSLLDRSAIPPSQAAPVNSSTPGAGAGGAGAMAMPNLANPSGLSGMPLPVPGLRTCLSHVSLVLVMVVRTCYNHSTIALFPLVYIYICIQ